MTNYSMTPIDNGTRLRFAHTTFSSVITSYNRGQLVVGDEVWEAPADGNEVKKGDKWLHVLSVDGVAAPDGWMAIIHKGYPICDNFKEVGTNPDPDPQPMFPASFVLTDPNGFKAEYAFVKVIE